MNYSKILIHSKTRKATENYLKSPTQVLALVGGEGVGKNFLGLQLASTLLDKEDLSNESRLIKIERQEDKKEIAIVEVRKLTKILRTKQPGASRRIVFIDEADTLSIEAQNALLKTLEQPNPDTLFILSVRDSTRLLPTVFSRTQKLVVHPVSEGLAKEFFAAGYSEQEIRTAWLLSEGKAGQLSQLLGSSQEQPLKLGIEAAKVFLSSSRYERLVSVDPLSKDRQQLTNLLQGLSRILKTLHHSNIRNGRQNVAMKLLSARKLVQKSQKALDANASGKAVLLNLVLNLHV